jgi:hypothetical protein
MMRNALLGRRLDQDRLPAPPTGPRIARLVLTAWLLALGGIWAAQQAHAGLHELVDLPPLLHLFRDASLAVPFAAVALLAAGPLAGPLARATGLGEGSLAGRLAYAAIAAVLFAVLSVPGNALHGLMVGATEDEGGLADVLLDAAIVLGGSLAVLVPAALAHLAPWYGEPDGAAAQLMGAPS